MEFYEWKFQTLFPRIEEQLLELGYRVHQARHREHAKDLLLDLIPKENSIGYDPSNALDQIDLLDALRARGYRLLEPGTEAGGTDQSQLRKTLHADTFLTGVDAITRDGRLVFLDKMGNRAAGVLFGPRQVILVASMNQVVPRIDVAVKRVPSMGPLFSEAEGEDGAALPNGKAAAPLSPEAEPACNSLTILENCLNIPGRIEIVLVMEHLN